MSHFYATISGHRGLATRQGTKNSGMHSQTAGWRGCISVYAYEQDGEDCYRVSLEPWQGSGGQSRMIAEGPLDANADEFITSGAAMGSLNAELVEALNIMVVASEYDLRRLDGWGPTKTAALTHARAALAKAKGD